MKKFLALTLVLVLILCTVSMTACRRRGNEDTSINTEATTVPTEASKETAPTETSKETTPTEQTEPDNNDENWSSDTEMEWSDVPQTTTPVDKTPENTEAPTQPTEAPAVNTEAPTEPATQEPSDGNTADEEELTGGDEWSSSSDIEWVD